MPHEHLALQSLDRLQGHAHHNDDGGAAQGNAAVGRRLTEAGDQDGDHGDDAQVYRAEQSNLVKDTLDKVTGGLAGPEAGDKPAVLLEIVGNLNGVELDGGVEVRKEDDQQQIHDGIGHRGGVEHPQEARPRSPCSPR